MVRYMLPIAEELHWTTSLAKKCEYIFLENEYIEWLKKMRSLKMADEREAETETETEVGEKVIPGGIKKTWERGP